MIANRGMRRNEPWRLPRPTDPEYLVRLIGQGITVSLETVKVVRRLPTKEKPAARGG